MSDRSEEILSALKRSPKKFTANNIIAFARYVTSLKEDEARIKLGRTPRTQPTNGSRAPKLPRGVNAELAKNSLLTMLQKDHQPLFLRFSSADKKNYTAICRAIQNFQRDINLQDFIDTALDKYSGTYSSNWKAPQKTK